MSNIIVIDTISGNPETQMRLIFGNNVSAPRVIEYVKRNAHMKEECGLISTQEAFEVVRQAEEKLKQLNMPV